LTYSAAPAVDAQGRPTGTEAITNLQSLSRSLVNAAGQVIAVGRYTNLSGLAYAAKSATLGLEGVNFLRTRYAYNNQGQVDRTQNPAGTITISTYDGLARLTATYVGTDLPPLNEATSGARILGVDQGNPRVRPEPRP
jgi:YD repeat-containing protein